MAVVSIGALRFQQGVVLKHTGYSLIELLLVISLGTVATIKGYHALHRGVEEYALNRTVAVMRTLAQRAKAFQNAHQKHQWPSNTKELTEYFGMGNMPDIRNGFGMHFDLDIFSGNDNKPAVLRISTALPESYQARYVASQLGYSARHHDNEVHWTHVPEVPHEHWLPRLDTLDADLNLNGNNIFGLRAINSDRRGHYDLRHSIIKVDRVIARSISANFISWIDQKKGPPLYYRRYPTDWPDYFPQYINPHITPAHVPDAPVSHPFGSLP